MARYGNFRLGSSAHAVLSLHTRHRSHTHRLSAHSRNSNTQRNNTQKQLFNITSQFEMWENAKQSHCVDRRPPDLEQSPASFSLIAQTSHHAVFRASFPNVDKCYQIRHNGSNSSMVCQSVLII